ncbi:MAG: penicillin-binding transpeptidase domain-containing protein, partial [Neofamilia sp.]
DIKNAPPLRCVSFAHPHGDITLRDALAKSCNPSFVYVNRELGRENFLKYIKAFGFGEKTGIDLTGEAIGMIPSSSESISEIGLATMSYGHGLAVTPIQLINAVSAIGNDGILMTPRVVKELVNSEGRVVKSMEISEKRQVISSETANIMLEMMSHVVESGTASRANSAIYRIGGKTGTANKVLENGYAEDQFVSSFVGLAPIDNPVISILVIVDNPKTQTYGSIVASPSAKNIIEYTLKLLGIKEKPRDSIDTNKDYVRVPDVTFRLIGEAGRMITDTDLKYTTEYVNITDDTIIISQNPKAGELVDRGSIVEFEIDLNNGETKIVPNLLGKQINEIEEYLNKIGVGYETEGAEEGVIVRMSPNYSSRIQAGEKITLVLGEKSELQGQDTSDPSLVDGLLEVENTENRPITSPEKDKSEEVIEEINEDNNEENSPDDKPSPNA